MLSYNDSTKDKFLLISKKIVQKANICTRYQKPVLKHEFAVLNDLIIHVNLQ